MNHLNTYNYCVYAYPNKIISEIIKRVSEKLQQKYSKYLYSRVSEDPHITIAFGPAISEGTNEITSLTEEVDELLSGFIKYFMGSYPIIHYCDVNHFERDNYYVIKVEFSSEIIDEMHMYLRNNNESISKNYLDLYSKTKKYDESAAPIPKRWIHMTLAIIKKDSQEIINEVEKLARDLLSEIQVESVTERISLISAMTDNEVILW